ncbi:S-adenosyl-L-methionine-dependent methyltransferase [Hypoxylon fragiforme]|uniref:S-adenosyl-L-methionine-dependent methyltransferase n=1 Tax=Hypoxylon fragiforme TaxID=63214 RepID=UPI0020C5BFDA|nr:S-adenosyl-L-methionine-dependent methyltransferase [Hypoxylon fragiforme]KAI2605853.1 S-adenosyl-L-methionine-dependent methyltransferase [Hypoxylon fragiforme]
MPTQPPTLLTRTALAITGLLGPWSFMLLSLSYLPPTILRLLQAQQPLTTTLLSPARLQELWFSEFWSRAAGPGVRGGAGDKVVPLLQGRTSGGAVVVEEEGGGKGKGKGIGGVVLEVGAGAGLWVDVYKAVGCRIQGVDDDDDYDDDDGDNEEEEEEGVRKRKTTGAAAAATSGRITRIYGVEPSPGQHAHLARAIATAGMEAVYRVAPVGIEDLADGTKWDGRVEKGSVDCVVTILCLCSIPEPERCARELYGYLKKGGRWYVYEHVRCGHSWYMRAYQRFVNLFWPFFLGGCQLTRPTEATIRAAGPWAEIDVGQPVAEPWFQVVPHVMGVFTK